MEYRHARAAAIKPIEHQAMQVDVEIGRRAEALDERVCAAVGFAAFEPRLLDQKGGNDPVRTHLHAGPPNAGRCEAPSLRASWSRRAIRTKLRCHAATTSQFVT